MKTVELHITLTEAQAWELAQFLKRVSFSTSTERPSRMPWCDPIIDSQDRA